MNAINFLKPVKIKDPLPGEEDLIFKITNYNDTTRRCYIQLISSLPSINPNIAPEELISIDDIVNVD